MEFFQLIANTTRRATCVSELITDHFQIPPFAQGDLIDGRIVVLHETGDPTAPTATFDFTTCTGVALTDGKNVIYANGGGILVLANSITFELSVASPELDAAMAAVPDADWIEAFFEVRISGSGQDGLLLREPVTIERAATGL
jgi:hypothetical protein